MREIKNNEHSICAQCNGNCCRHMGCEISPEDVIKWKGEITEQTITELLDTEYISIDWWEGDPRRDIAPGEKKVSNGYYLRMRHVGMFAIDPSFGGVCKALKPDGCALTWDQRPTGGKLLVPDPDNPARGCESIYGKRIPAIEWIPYNTILEKVRFTYGY